MSKSQRDKGHNFEREIANLLSDELGTVVKRNLSQTRGGKDEGSDITVGPFSIECKRRAAFSFYAYLEQAKRDAPDGKVPIVVLRGDGKKPAVLIDLECFIPLMRGEM